jgi:phosphate-selective porin OprO/OprP
MGYSHEFRGSGFFQRYRQRPAVHLENRWADTGAIIPARDIDLLNPELAVVWGPLSLQAEWVQTFVKNDDRHNNDFYGAYVETSYFLTGEHRNYELGKGRFGRIKPLENFDPGKGDWGAWQLAARFSYLDLYDGFVQGGTLWTITAAVNWYLFPNARVMLNYVHGNLRDRTVLPTGGNPRFDDVNGEGDAVQVRFQIDF